MNVQCDSCPTRLVDQDSYARARAKGWHVYQGPTNGGAEVSWVLCPECVGARTRLPRAPAVLPGQEELDYE